LRTFHAIPRYLPRYCSAGGVLLIAQSWPAKTY
jgi:hypothetical protein